MKMNEPLRIEEFDHVPPAQVSSLMDGLYLDGAVRIDIERSNEKEDVKLVVYFEEVALTGSAA